jgi:hypothetical protein
MTGPVSQATSHASARRKRALAASCLIWLVFDIAVGAAHAATRDEQEKACRGDAIKFCKAEIPNKGKITACMKQHKRELSPGCQAMFKSGKQSDDESDQSDQDQTESD